MNNPFTDDDLRIKTLASRVICYTNTKTGAMRAFNVFRLSHSLNSAVASLVMYVIDENDAETISLVTSKVISMVPRTLKRRYDSAQAYAFAHCTEAV